MNTRAQQRGVALLTALLIVALATVAATAMTRTQQLTIRRAQNLLHADQAYLHALGVENWGRGMLEKDFQQDQITKIPVDAMSENWNVPLPPTEVQGGMVNGRIEDLQARFNLNNLVAMPGSSGADPHAQLAYFQRLLRHLALDPALAQSIADWLDSDLDSRYPGGAEDLVYMREDLPYRAGNTHMGDISELLLIDGVTPEIYARLAPFVTALPRTTKINVNTAPKLVLIALSDDIDETKVTAALASREIAGFSSVDSFFETAGIESGQTAAPANHPAPGQIEEARQFVLPGQAPRPQTGTQLESLVGVNSDFFIVHSRARIDRMRVQIASVIVRGEPDGPRVISRTRLPFQL